jgi:hypothetical protein
MPGLAPEARMEASDMSDVISAAGKLLHFFLK